MSAYIVSLYYRRKQGIYNRQMSKLYLKANCIKPQGQVTEAYFVKVNLAVFSLT